MTQPPQLLPTTLVTHLMSSPLFLFFGGGVGAYLLYRFVFRALGKLATLGTLALLGLAAYAAIKLHHWVATWQQHTLHPVSSKVHTTPLHSATGVSSGITNPLTAGSQQTGVPKINLNAMSPLAHENAWIIAFALIVAMLWALGYLIYRGMSPTKRAKFLHRMRTSSITDVPPQREETGQYPISSIELAIRKDNGKPIVIEGKDRFINTLVLGSIGTGKTSRILLKAIYQDLRAMASEFKMDAIVVDPDGEFAKKVTKVAQELHLDTDIIDLRGEDDGTQKTEGEPTENFLESTVSFNPFSDGNIADIIDNVRAAMQEKMGKQEGFFQNAQDDLIRTVIQVQVPLWPETDFLQFADLVTDPLHFRAICRMINEYATLRTSSSSSKKKKKEDETEDFIGMWENERSDVESRYDTMSPVNKSMVLSATRSFLMDTRSEKKLEQLESITKGLKIVVGELAYNPRLRKVFGTNNLPPFNLKSFLNTGTDKKGRLMVVITGNQPAGKLFGKLFLVTLKMYTLRRVGTENTRRPVYLYIDEFAVFGTESFTEMFSQARKYRVGMMLAIQARAQLLDVSKKFQDVVEGSCRNKVYFPAPSPDDARFLEHSLGTATNIKETHTENKLTWFWLDNRNLDRKISRTESIDPRYRLEDIAYGLTKDEAIFVMTVDNQQMPPTVGLTSWADVWVTQKHGFFSIPQSSETQKWTLPKWKLPSWIRTRGVTTSENSTSVEGMAQLTAIPASDDTSSVNENFVAPAVQKPMPVYVKPTANPDTVIPIKNLLQRQEGMPSETMHNADKPIETVENLVETETKTGPVTAKADSRVQKKESPPQVKRYDLRKRNETQNSVPIFEASTKLCPQCKTVKLELTPDERKWCCPSCGFERKKR